MAGGSALAGKTLIEMGYRNVVMAVVFMHGNKLAARWPLFPEPTSKNRRKLLCPCVEGRCCCGDGNPDQLLGTSRRWKV